MLEDREDMDQELDLVELEDEEGGTTTMRVVDYFFYNGEEYVILAGDVDENGELIEDMEEVPCAVMKVQPVEGEDGEMEEFLPIEDAQLEETLIEIANTRMNEDAAE